LVGKCGVGGGNFDLNEGVAPSQTLLAQTSQLISGRSPLILQITFSSAISELYQTKVLKWVAWKKP
jgi:fatty acid-binding protein DegV